MTVTITAQQLVQFARPKGDIAMIWAPHLQREANAHGIVTNRRCRHWMATLAHECGGFGSMVENLNYSTEALLKLFSRSRISAADAAKFGRGPGRAAHQNALANILYGGEFGRRNLGNTQPGDGWRYRGRGPIMLTGRANYAAMERLTGLSLVANPDLASQPAAGAKIAAAWWQSKGLNKVVDEDPGESRMCSTIEACVRLNEMDDVREARRIVNGGHIGITDVQDWLIKAARFWP